MAKPVSVAISRQERPAARWARTGVDDKNRSTCAATGVGESYVVDHLRDEAAVLVVDETGDVKKDTHTVGVSSSMTAFVDEFEQQLAITAAGECS
ncbi:hypothetical protein [Streptomyces hayashii]|uniref:hypothetical protein n=1 Tax=Streptomyces hayashii TaxID=2839966 RepID=UPI00403CAE29